MLHFHQHDVTLMADMTFLRHLKVPCFGELFIHIHLSFPRTAVRVCVTSLKGWPKSHQLYNAHQPITIKSYIAMIYT